MASWKDPRRFATTNDALAAGDHSAHSDDHIPQRLLRVANAIQANRDRRGRHFQSRMFGEAAWDMLLAAFIAHARGYRLKVSDICYEARVPTSTALRWLDQLLGEGLVTRTGNHLDRRSSLVEISETGLGAMIGYLEEVDLDLSRIEPRMI